MAQTIGEAYINIMPSADNFGASLNNSLGGLTGVATTAGVAIGAAVTAGVGAAVGLTGAVSDLAQTTDAIDKASQKLGVSASFYQEWDAVLQHSGTSMDAMTATFKKLATSSQDATDSQIEAYKALGLTMDEVSSMSSEELFKSVITGLQGMEESTERTALATELLGRGAMELGPLMNTSAEDTQAMIDTVNELGGVLSDTAVKDGAAFQDNLQDLQTAMSGLVNGMLVEFLPGFNQVMEGLTAFIAGDEAGLEQVTDGIKGILNNITDMLPEFLDLAVTIIEGLAEAIIENLPALMNTGVEIIGKLGSFILDNLPMLVESAIEIITQLANDLSAQLPTLIPAIVDVMLTIVDTLIENIDMLIDASIQLITALAEGLIDALPVLMEKTPDIIVKLVEGLVAEIPQLLTCAFDLIVALGDGLIESLPELAKGTMEIINALKDGLLEGLADIIVVGGDLIEGFWQGIGDKKDWIIEKIKGFGDAVLQGMKDFFGIASPSKVMRDEIGKFLPEGMAVGIEANADAVTDAMDSIAYKTLETGVNITGNIADYSMPASSDMSNNSAYELLAQYLPIIASNQPQITLEGDAGKLFNVIQKQSKIYNNQFGKPAFA